MPPTLAEKREAVARATDPNGRLVRTSRLETRSVTRAADGSIGFRGEAIVFNTPTWIGSRDFGFFEEIAPEAVTRTLAEADVRFLLNHDPNLLLARTSSGTLRLSATPTGVQVDADMAPVSYAQDAAVLLERGDLTQMSFAFEPLAWVRSERDGKDLYRVTEMAMYDVSAVTFPAYETTSGGLRSAAFDVLCRSAGLDAAGARRLVRELTDNGDSAAPDDVLEQLRAVIGPLNFMAPSSASLRAFVDDDTSDPKVIATALDAVIDELNDSAGEAEPDQTAALAQAADLLSDLLLTALGVPDATEAPEGAGRSKHAPAETTRASDGDAVSPPAETTDTRKQLRLATLATRTHLLKESI